VRSIFAVTDACAGCGACLKTCPEKAIRPAPRDHGTPLIVLEDRCSGCAECAEVCPVSACVEVLPTPVDQAPGTLHRVTP
jgi:NAD-dependent dihydropyrimidine dehydrogenase PreA subunit